jgi:glycosyltransferase involved in cell wall biosynthesis
MNKQGSALPDVRHAEARGVTLQVAYLVNQYPKVSHTFIRREIAALERQGVSVQRMALRGWDAEVTDAEDAAERERTSYVLRAGVASLVRTGIGAFLRMPVRMARGLREAWAMSVRSERSFPWHVIYLFEAVLVARWMARSGTRHLHAHFGTNAAEVALLTRVLCDASYSFTVHGPEEFDKPEGLHLGRKSAAASFVVAISSFGRSQLCRWTSTARWPHIQVVHCGLEEAFFARPGELAAVSAPRLVCVGRLCEQKGQLLLVDAAARLAAEGVAFELVLAGDGEMRTEIEQAIARHGIAPRVRITGWISSEQVRNELLAARALVLPSFAEGLPVVIMEAMAIGRPVISTFVAGIPELVQDGVNGWLVPAGDVQAVAAAMRDALAASPERLLEMGVQAHRRVHERHHVDVEASRLKSLFQKALEGQS